MDRANAARPDVAGSRKAAETRQLILDLGRAPAFDIEDFLVSPSNLRAFQTLDRWPDWPDRMLVLAGPPGSGKSHLASIWARHADARIVGPRGPLDPGTVSGSAAIVLEDCDRSARSEAELFHLINVFKEHEGWLLLTARTNPGCWNIQTADLLSRLRLAPIIQIGQPNTELVRAVLVKLFADRQIRIEEEIVTFATLHLDQSLDAVTRFVQAVDDSALALGRRITRPIASAAIATLQDGKS